MAGRARAVDWQGVEVEVDLMELWLPKQNHHESTQSYQEVVADPEAAQVEEEGADLKLIIIQ